MTRRPWVVPAGLVLLTVVPAIGGAVRLVQLAQGAVTPDNERFLASPVPVVVHIVGAVVFLGVGAFQFVPALRRRGNRWHRWAGRVLVPAGLAGALGGLEMTLFQRAYPGDGELLQGIRLVVGTAMVTSLVLGYLAARRGAWVRHRTWMMRGYAIGMGAGTQLFTLGGWAALVGTPTGTARALLHALGWLINLVIVEVWLYRRSSRTPVRRPPALRTAQVSSGT